MTKRGPVQPPAAEGKRLPWSAIPEPLRAEVERHLGGRVAEAVTQPGGFSPGVAARLRLDDGRRAFVKAVDGLNPDAPRLHRAEARISAALPDSTPAPRLLGSIDAGGWVILMFEDVDGRVPAQPWQPAELARVLEAMGDLATSLTPAPVDALPAADQDSNVGRGWDLLARDVRSGADDLAGVDPWVPANLDGLLAQEERWPTAVQGSTLAHSDIRADNILLTADRVMFVDWPWACLAPPWFDLVGLLPSVAMQGGPQPEEVLAGHVLVRDADPDSVTVMVSCLAGYFTYQSRQPDPPGLPTVREFQRAQGVVALDWLKVRLGAA